MTPDRRAVGEHEQRRDALDLEARGQLGLAIGFAVGGPLVDLIGARDANYVVAAVTLAMLAMWVGPWRRAGATQAAGHA